jgi:single-strand DNA-binding protein
MNRVCLVGRLTAKPELRYTNSNLPVSRFSLAINRTFTNSNGEREADFINIVVWRKQAENVCNFLDKGSLVSVEGRIQTGSYDDKDGKRVYTFEVVADSVQFLEPKGQRGQNSSFNQEPKTTPYDFETPTSDVNDDPFAEFGDSVSIDDNFLE